MRGMVEVEVWRHRETPAAVQVSLTGDVEDAVWLPLGQLVDYQSDTPTDYVRLEMPRWLAEKEGLV